MAVQGQTAATEYKIVVMGGGGVGKSALTIRLVTDNFLEDYDPTIEDSYCKQMDVDGVPALLDILDTAGQEEFSSMQDQWMREGQGFMLVYDITQPETLDDVELLREKILRSKDDVPPENLAIVLCGNKVDLEHKRAITTEQGQQLAESWKCKFYETSAKTCINHHQCFFEVVRLLRRPQVNKPAKKDEKKKKDAKGSVCQIL
mmetsp:Transcript_40976/g.65893  ORF Transcript_40976/g.65893 Transcript_40976/m.65893 type:complete len:203 (+) Transcript_40976:14-622(+)|eukprot:CAMPEP_0197020700 /NCGR_PEP_ID=MMETSP1384-20130603/1564_1 /TAXON_ID=29189 /ORGANISM="Ammonia sp." /LENGTH=202 /DNA_ID=CAMNT_0042448377 /DNA_START=14 /DNA_END=622 /DNA_ORIENTATION=-